MRLSVLGSGSRGNCIALLSEDYGLLIDVGFSYVEIHKRLKKIGWDPEQFRDILISHRHTDHCRSIQKWVRNGARVYCTEDTVKYGDNTGMRYLQNNVDDWTCIPIRKAFEVQGFQVVAVPAVHGCSGAVTFIVRQGTKKVATYLETGEITAEMYRHGLDAEVYVIEANHDKWMNASNDQRGDTSAERTALWHLNNEQVCEFLREGLSESAHTVILSHISTTRVSGNGHVQMGNNDPALLEKVASEALEGTDVRLILSQQDEPTEVISV